MMRRQGSVAWFDLAAPAVMLAQPIFIAFRGPGGPGLTRVESRPTDVHHAFTGCKPRISASGRERRRCPCQDNDATSRRSYAQRTLMASTAPLLPETYIVPVCRYDETAGTANIRAFHGTAFFINDHGAFVTARHVVEAAAHDVDQNGGILGLCVRPPGGGGSVISSIRELDVAHAPHDLCFGLASGDFPTLLTLGNAPVGTWRDVAALGYPATAANVSAGGILDVCSWLQGLRAPRR
jgi:hypothetical protein